MPGPQELLHGIHFYLNDEADADGVCGCYIPRDFTLDQVSTFVTHTGSPTAETIDIQDDGTDILAAHDISSNGIVDVTNATIVAGSAIELDLNLSGGSTPKTTGEIVLWGHWGK